MIRVIVIGGPTAVGKTAFAVALAKQIQGEIINADSMQVYRGLDIGTAKITPEEQEGIPHHLFNLMEPTEPFDVARYQLLARQAIEEITARGHYPILVGGTGLYVRATLYDYHFPPASQNEHVSFDQDSTESLYSRLQELDALAASQVHPHNRKRIERALHRYAESGPLQVLPAPEICYDTLFIGLTRPRPELYARINQRVELQFVAGLEDEARKVMELAPEGATSRQAIGYKEFLPYWEQMISRETLIETIQQNTRRYAKRQYTWWSHQFPMQWVNVEEERDPMSILEEMHQLVLTRWPQ